MSDVLREHGMGKISRSLKWWRKKRATNLCTRCSIVKEPSRTMYALCGECGVKNSIESKARWRLAHPDCVPYGNQKLPDIYPVS